MLRLLLKKGRVVTGKEGDSSLWRAEVVDMGPFRAEITKPPVVARRREGRRSAPDFRPSHVDKQRTTKSVPPVQDWEKLDVTDETVLSVSRCRKSGVRFVVGIMTLRFRGHDSTPTA